MDAIERKDKAIKVKTRYFELVKAENPKHEGENTKAKNDVIAKYAREVKMDHFDISFPSNFVCTFRE